MIGKASWLKPKLKRKLRWWLHKPWLAAPFAWARGNSEPPAEQNDMHLVSINCSVICPGLWFVPFYFSINFTCIAQLRQPCKYCWHHWYKLHQKGLKFHSRESMVATWPRWLFEPSLPLIMKYTSCVHHIMCHGKQDAKVICDGYNQQLSTKSVEQTRRAPKEISESISVDRNMPTTTSQADFLNNVKTKRSFDKDPDQSPTLTRVDVPQATLGVVSMVIDFALGVLNVATIAVGNDRDLLVELIVRAQWMLSSKCSAPAIITPQCSASQGYGTQQVNAR